MQDFTEELCNLMRSRDIIPPANFIADGKIHRFSSIGERGDDAGWYIIYDGEIPVGAFGCWRLGIKEKFRINAGRQLTPQEEAVHKAHLDGIRLASAEEEQTRHTEARKKAQDILNVSQAADNTHPYLAGKQVKAHGLYVHNGKLVVPVRGETGELHSLQLIDANGDKRFLTGGRVKGCSHLIGEPHDVIGIAEGYATAATVHEATSYAVAVAFNAGNLLPVAEALRKKHPNARLILCADNDWLAEGNPGLTKATEAARAGGAILAVPAFRPDRPDGATDFNDMAALYGLDTVKKAIVYLTASEVKPEKNLVPCQNHAVELLRGSDMEPEPISWLWGGWLALGKMHVLGGAPGTGKTTIAIKLAATVTTGGFWPDGGKSPVGNVVIWSGEDDISDTLIPRLALSGADLSRVYFVGGVQAGNEQRPFDPAKDMEALRRKLIEVGNVVLLIVDPIVSAVASDSHKNAETRRALQPLADLAMSMRCALLGITHFTKGTAGRDPIDRITGSLAFGALPRVVMVAAKEQKEEGNDHPARRLFLRAKSNIGPDEGGFVYDLLQSEMKTHPGIFSSSATWGEAIKGTARDLLAEAEALWEKKGSEGVIDNAKKFLSDLLTKGPRPTKEIHEDADNEGISWRTIHRAKKKLGIEAKKDGLRGGWTWKLPATFDLNALKLNALKNANKAEECQTEAMATFENSGNLRDDSNITDFDT